MAKLVVEIDGGPSGRFFEVYDVVKLSHGEESHDIVPNRDGSPMTWEAAIKLCGSDRDVRVKTLASWEAVQNRNHFVREFIEAGRKLLEFMQDEEPDLWHNYPKYLPSFDEFLADLEAMADESDL